MIYVGYMIVDKLLKILTISEQYIQSLMTIFRSVSRHLLGSDCNDEFGLKIKRQCILNGNSEHSRVQFQKKEYCLVQSR